MTGIGRGWRQTVCSRRQGCKRYITTLTEAGGNGRLGGFKTYFSRYVQIRQAMRKGRGTGSCGGDRRQLQIYVRATLEDILAA